MPGKKILWTAVAALLLRSAAILRRRVCLFTLSGRARARNLPGAAGQLGTSRMSVGCCRRDREGCSDKEMKNEECLVILHSSLFISSCVVFDCNA
jgi:hypothetical protein